MNAGSLNRLELLRRTLLGQLQTADANLRSGLHQHGMDALVRAKQTPADESATSIHV